MHKSSAAFSLLLLCTIAGQACARTPDPTVFTEVELRGVSEVMPVMDTIGDFDGELNPQGDFAYTHNEARAGVQYGRWAVSGYYRYDYYLEFDTDTALLVYQRANDLPVASDQNYQIDLWASHVQGSGISLDYTFKFTPRLSLKVRGSLLRASDLVHGSITGDISVAGDGTYVGVAQVHYFYSEDYLFNRPDVSSPSAWGGTLDLYGEYRFNEQFRIRVEAEDLYSRVEWDDAPVTIAAASSSRTQLDADGLLNVQPFLSGIESEQDFTQTFPRRYRALLDYQTPGPLDWQLESNWVKSRHYHRVNAKYSIADDLALDFSAGIETQALGLGLSYRKFQFFVLSDRLDLSEAGVLELRCQFQFAF
tara:strand:+ start:172 stop:1263 length:1092 start_codon:yes stop_codon:yes gene_type:complete